jgi:hypothetical protein
MSRFYVDDDAKETARTQRAVWIHSITWSGDRTDF